MRPSRVAFVPFLLAAAPALAATICVDPHGGPCQTTIQAGVNLAGPGDLVQIAAGVYFENVTVPPGKNGLRIVGAGRRATIVDAGRYDDLGQTENYASFRIESPDVRLSALGARNGNNGLVALAPRMIAQDVHITAVIYGVLFFTNSFAGQVLQSEMDLVTVGVTTFEANDLQVRDSQFNLTVVAVDADGNRVQVVGNRVEGGGIAVDGNDALVRQNILRNTTNAVRVYGARPRIEGNTVNEVGHGLVVSCPRPGDPDPPADACTGAAVSGNSVTDALNQAVMVVAGDPGLVVETNSIQRAAEAITVTGEGVTVRQNTVTDSGRNNDVSCIELVGTDHVAAANIVARCGGTGLCLDGERLRAEENRLLNGYADGLHVNGINTGPPFAGNALVGNQVNENVGWGILVWRTEGTAVTGNVALRNRIDFCDAGTGTVLSGNQFTVAGVCPL
jgi:hypothetical protein